MGPRILPIVLIAVAVPLVSCGTGDSGGGGAEGGDSTPATRLVVVAKDERFEPTQLQAPAGSVSVELDNRDEAILHNIRFYKGTSADGTLVRKSDIKRGIRSDTLKLKLDEGTYFYDCEVHPASMTGTLKVGG